MCSSRVRAPLSLVITQAWIHYILTNNVRLLRACLELFYNGLDSIVHRTPESIFLFHVVAGWSGVECEMGSWQRWGIIRCCTACQRLCTERVLSS